MEKETYSRLSGERLNEIQEISNKIDFKNLTYYFKTSGISPINFTKFKGPFSFFKEIRDDDKILKEKEEQIKFKSKLKEIAKGKSKEKSKDKSKEKSKDKSNTIENVKILYHPRQEIINLFNDNSKITSAAIHKRKTR